MLQINELSQCIELQIVGGGNWITENFPTNFHNFYKRKMLTANDSPDNYREVTDAQKATIEASDAKWTKPDQWIIDRFNDWCKGEVIGQKFDVGGYNESTGYFECNGILDIGVDEAKAMLEYAPATRFYIPNHGENRWTFGKTDYRYIRTVFPICFVNSGGSSGSASLLFCAWGKLEVVHFAASNFSQLSGIFNSCNSLRRVTNLNANVTNFTTAFWNCYNLEYIELKNPAGSFGLNQASKLQSESLYYIVKNKVNTNQISITLHPDVYAKITDEDNDEWFPLIALAEEKNITFISA